MGMIHFYHVYADGRWQDPLEEHVEALTKFGLLDALDKMYVGYVGSDENVKQAEKYMRKNTSGKAETINKASGGWEQETMRLIPAHITDEAVLYCHSKGSSDPSPINIAWRRSMTMECVVDWRRPVLMLKNNDAVGPHWLTYDKIPFFGGNFWWANAQYLLSLPLIEEENRWNAESWIGMGENPRIYDLKPGHPGETPLDTDWRYV